VPQGSHAPKVASLLADAELGLLAFHAFPAERHSKLRSTIPLERVNCGIGRRSTSPSSSRRPWKPSGAQNLGRRGASQASPDDDKDGRGGHRELLLLLAGCLVSWRRR
jgi:hypothetical protein